MSKIRLPKITLTIRGRNLISNNGSEHFDWANALIDSGIFAAISFFGAFGGSQVVSIPSGVGLICAGFSACFSFFTFLGMKRGIVKK